MAVILVSFFAVIIAVNVLMARIAVGSFGGTVVDNSYVASQRFNGWLAEARAERSVGWQVAIEREAAGTVLVGARTADGAPLSGTIISAAIRRPMGAATEQNITFTAAGPGQMRSTEPLAPGRWQLRATLTSGGQQMRVAQDLP